MKASSPVPNAQPAREPDSQPASAKRRGASEQARASASFAGPLQRKPAISLGIAGLQSVIGNAAFGRLLGANGSPGAVSRLVQRVSVGTPPTPKPTKQWEAMGGFSGKHMVEEELTNTSARDKWTERYKKDKKGWKNTVVAKADLTEAIAAGKVTGAYPQARTPQRLPMIVEVPAKTVTGRKRDGKDVPGAVADLTKIGVTGSATEGIYFPDHLEGSLSG